MRAYLAWVGKAGLRFKRFLFPHGILYMTSRIRRMEGADGCPNGRGAAARMGGAKQTAARYRQNQSGMPFVCIVDVRRRIPEPGYCTPSLQEGAGQCDGATKANHPCGNGGSRPNENQSRGRDSG